MGFDDLKISDGVGNYPRDFIFAVLKDLIKFVKGKEEKISFSLSLEGVAHILDIIRRSEGTGTLPRRDGKILALLYHPVVEEYVRENFLELKNNAMDYYGES